MKEITLEVKFGDGILRAWLVAEPLHHYDGPDARNQTGLTFVSGLHELEVQSAEALYELARQRGISFEQQVTANPASFATVYWILFEHEGRVVHDAGFWDFLDTSYGVSSTELTPRVEGSRLRFTLAKLNIFQSDKYFINVTIDLRSGAIKKEKVEITRRDTANRKSDSP